MNEFDKAMDKLKKAVEADKNTKKKPIYNGHFRDRAGMSKHEFDFRKSANKYSYR
jgi:hypothetical protein